MSQTVQIQDVLGCVLRLCTVQSDRRPSSDMAAFRAEFAKAKHVLVLTGAGVSAESGVPTFRGAGGFWRKWQAQVVILITTILLLSVVVQ